MRRLFLLITVFLLLAGPALGYDVLLVQSSRNAAYEEVMRGFKSSCAKESRLLVLSDFGNVDLVRIVKEDRPRLVVAVGDEALAATKNVRQTPVLALMTLGLRAASARANVTGIDLFVTPEGYLPVFDKLKARRVGMVYNAGKSGWYVKRAIAAARQAGIEIVQRDVRTLGETVTSLDALQGKVDALWLIPDTTAVATETISAYFNFSIRQKAPVISFTAAHLRLGAAAAVDIDRRAMGRQAGEMALKLLKGANPADLPVEQPETFAVKANPVVLENLGLTSLVKILTLSTP